MKDLNKPVNEYLRFFDKYNRDTALILISSIAGIISVLALLMAWMATNDAKAANIRSQMQTETILQLTDTVDHYKILKRKMDAWLRANGVPVEEIYDD